jgi:hypothetical protein
MRHFWVDIYAKVEEKVVGLMIVHEKNPSSFFLVEIKMRHDVYTYMVKYIRRKFAHLKDKLQPCPPSHEPLSYYILEMGDEFVEEHIATLHVEDIGHEEPTSFFHEDKGSVTCYAFQNSNFDDVMVHLDDVVFEEKSLYDDGMLMYLFLHEMRVRATKILKLVRRIFSLIAIVRRWIIRRASGILSMTLMGMILGNVIRTRSVIELIDPQNVNQTGIRKKNQTKKCIKYSNFEKKTIYIHVHTYKSKPLYTNMHSHVYNK